jgi:23S rRNA (cytidine1920-2'-O)/16S rRNA (cytidine1409-2'-O)-methyltransferase
MIMAGVVEVNGVRAEKPGQSFDPAADVSVKSNTLPYVSRGGLKLEAALDHFNIDVSGLTVIDIGHRRADSRTVFSKGAQKESLRSM